MTNIPITNLKRHGQGSLLYIKFNTFPLSIRILIIKNLPETSFVIYVLFQHLLSQNKYNLS